MSTFLQQKVPTAAGTTALERPNSKQLFCTPAQVWYFGTSDGFSRDPSSSLLNTVSSGVEHRYSHHAAHRTWQNDDANAHLKVTLISQSKSQGERRGISVLYDTKTLLLLEKCVTEGLKLSNQVLIPDSNRRAQFQLCSVCPGKIIYRHYLWALCWPGVRVVVTLHSWSPRQRAFGHNVFTWKLHSPRSPHSAP